MAKKKTLPETSKPLPAAADLPADKIMQQIEEMQLDDSVKKVFCIVLSDQDRNEIHGLITITADLLDQHGSTKETLDRVRELAARFEPQPDEEDYPADDPFNPETDSMIETEQEPQDVTP